MYMSAIAYNYSLFNNIFLKIAIQTNFLLVPRLLALFQSAIHHPHRKQHHVTVTVTLNSRENSAPWKRNSHCFKINTIFYSNLMINYHNSLKLRTIYWLVILHLHRLARLRQILLHMRINLSSHPTSNRCPPPPHNIVPHSMIHHTNDPSLKHQICLSTLRRMVRNNSILCQGEQLPEISFVCGRKAVVSYLP